MKKVTLADLTVKAGEFYQFTIKGNHKVFICYIAKDEKAIFLDGTPIEKEDVLNPVKISKEDAKALLSSFIEDLKSEAENIKNVGTATFMSKISAVEDFYKKMFEK